MTKRMLIDATHPEETRVAVISGNKLEEYDYETVVRKQLKGNIYLVKVTRVEPSLQAAFVDFGGNRHGFLPFPEIHPDYYRIPIADREALLAEERALAAEQAAREDEEDAAELAAQGHSLEDFDDEDEDEGHDEEGHEHPTATIIEVAEEAYVPKHTGSLAADMDNETLTDDEDDAEEDTAEQAAGIAAETEAAQHHFHAHEAAPETAYTEASDAEAQAPAGDAGAEQAPEHAGDASAEATAPARPQQRRGRHNGDKDGDVEMVGGDVVESPVYRSSIKRRYKIQEVIKRNQIMLIQISKEERGNKGAAVTSYISLPGRYCVLMPNSPRGGGVSRKVSNAKDRQRLKKILQELNVPEGMSVILRTAGVARSKAEIKRDLDYLLRLWDQIREYTLKSSAPALIYEEGNLIKRAIRDLYRRDIDEVHVAGETGYTGARDFMKTLMPSHADRIHQYNDETIPLFFRYQVESQIDEIHNPTVHLKSGGYIVINPTEAMVSIDVNSGRATKGRHIEETALKTNIEAADEIARQLRLRDQGGLIVIDFIDMEDKRNDRIVERRLRDAMQNDRARIQLGRISAFGLLELSRQRLHPSLVETNFEVCKHCQGSGLVRTVETTAVLILRALEEEGLRGRASEVCVNLPGEIALYIFNHKREMLANIERRYNIRISLRADESLLKPAYNIEVVKTTGQQARDNRPQRPQHVQTVDMSDLPELTEEDITDHSTVSEDDMREEGRSYSDPAEAEGGGRGRHGGRDRNRGRGRDNRGDRHGNRDGNRDNNRDRNQPRHQADAEGGDAAGFEQGEGQQQQPRHADGEGDEGRNGRRRGRRGGRRRGGRRGDRPFDRNREGGFDAANGDAAGNHDGNPEGNADFNAEGFNAEGGEGGFEQGEGAPEFQMEGGEGQQQQRRDGGNREGGRNRGRRGGRNRHRGERGDRGPRQQSAEGTLPGMGEQPSYEAAPQSREERSYEAPQQQQATGTDGGNAQHSGGESQGEGGDGKSRKGWWKRLTE